MKIIIEIAKNCKKWTTHKGINKNLFKKAVELIINCFSNLAVVKKIELSVLLTDNDEMQILNHKFRGKDKATNVLSFPDAELNWKQLLEFRPDMNYMYLGDIAFAYDVVNQEAMFLKIPFEDHFAHLLIHSILHLLGYDHISQEDAEHMEALETKILNLLLTAAHNQI